MQMLKLRRLKRKFELPKNDKTFATFTLNNQRFRMTYYQHRRFIKNKDNGKVYELINQIDDKYKSKLRVDGND